MQWLYACRSREEMGTRLLSPVDSGSEMLEGSCVELGLKKAILRMCMKVLVTEVPQKQSNKKTVNRVICYLVLVAGFSSTHFLFLT
jgi:hypothetical protein